MAYSKTNFKNRNEDTHQELAVGDVLKRTDIVSLISEVVDLQQQGSRLVGLCPFHSDSKPSFTVSGEKGVYGCWSCSAGLNGNHSGNAVTFVRRYFDMSFKEALIFLADRAGMPVSDGFRRTVQGVGAGLEAARKAIPKETERARSFSNTTKQAAQERPDTPNRMAPVQPLYDLMEMAQNAYCQALAQDYRAISYLTQTRGISPALLGRFRIGYAPDQYTFLKSVVGDELYDDKPLIDAGLVRISAKGSKYDFFRNRLVFGLRNDDGQVVAIGGRTMAATERRSSTPSSESRFRPPPKYLNSPETAIFDKSHELFGWFENRQYIREASLAIVVEGYMDVVGLANQDVNVAVGCMGVALSEAHAKKLTSEVKNIVFCFDGDKAGQEASMRSMLVMLPHLTDNIRVSFLRLPDGLDPDDYIKKNGKAAFFRQVSSAQSLIAFWAQLLQERFPGDTDKERRALWDFAQEQLRPLSVDLALRTALSNEAARLSGREGDIRTHETFTRLQKSESFVMSGPSDKLRLAAMRCPQAAIKIRPALDRYQHKHPDLHDEIAQWLELYDAACQAGLTKPVTLPPDELSHYERTINASPAILEGFCAELVRERMANDLGLTLNPKPIHRKVCAKPS